MFANYEMYKKVFNRRFCKVVHWDPVELSPLVTNVSSKRPCKANKRFAKWGAKGKAHTSFFQKQNSNPAKLEGGVPKIRATLKNSRRKRCPSSSRSLLRNLDDFEGSSSFFHFSLNSFNGHSSPAFDIADMVVFCNGNDKLQLMIYDV